MSPISDVTSSRQRRRNHIVSTNSHAKPPCIVETNDSKVTMQNESLKGTSSVKSSFHDDTKLSTKDNKFNKMLKSPTLEAHPRLEKKIRLMGSRSLDRASGIAAETSHTSNKKIDENIVEIVKYSNDSPQLKTESIIYIENDDDEMASTKTSNDTNKETADVTEASSKDCKENRPKSETDHLSNRIVSILKRKDESSSSSNASPNLTFSPSVVDSRNTRQGILKKRCSLDESRYSRSQSDERTDPSVNNRRSSFEETHGILKQPSYDKDDVLISSHGILKKKDSISLSNETKHVSIAQAVILAAADIADLEEDDRSYEIKPILKQDSIHASSTPKPILKKKYSFEGEELRGEEVVRPILKSSRKSSRDDNYSDTDNEYSCGSSLSSGTKSILKTDSPAKRRSIVIDPFECNLILERSRSLENPEMSESTPYISPERIEYDDHIVTNIPYFFVKFIFFLFTDYH